MKIVIIIKGLLVIGITVIFFIGCDDDRTSLDEKIMQIQGMRNVCAGPNQPYTTYEGFRICLPICSGLGACK